MMWGRRLVHIAFVLMCVLISGATELLATPWTPVEWQDGGKLRNWVRDVNGNFIDDLIEGQRGQVDVVVGLNQCIGDPSASSLVQYLNTVGDVTFVGEYLSIITVSGVNVGQVSNIANRPEVAMVELEPQINWLSTNFEAAKVEDSSKYNANNLQDKFGWPTTLNGSGVNIAFLDQGVSSSKESTLGISVPHGYDAISDVEGNPTPGSGSWHADAMATWVFGPSGIAPKAGLIDVKVGTASGLSPGALERALEKIYQRRIEWQINAVCMMFSIGISSGKEAVCKYIDMLSGSGVVVVASAGDNQANWFVEYPAAADRAIAVSAADMKDSTDRTDDVATFVKGPRSSDNDGDHLDELKPEIVMPTGEGDTAVSNSIAAATTAGLVALIQQYDKALGNPSNKAAGSVKDLLIRTAEPKGTPYTSISLSYPHATPTWAQYWGFGEIDAFNAFQHLSGAIQTGRTDLTFVGFDDSSHPSTPSYFSRAVETLSEREGRNIKAGAPDTIYARIHNNGSENATRAKVSFGFYPFTAGIPKFYDIGSVVTDIAKGAKVEVKMNWIPPALPGNEVHGCILVTIDYGYDSDFSGGSNFAQKNVRIESASSPAAFAFRVENTLPDEAMIELEVSSVHRDWTATLSETSFALSPHACARTIQAVVEPPPDAPPGAEALFFVTAYATEVGRENRVEIGGVALRVRKQALVRAVLGGSLFDTRPLRNAILHAVPWLDLSSQIFPAQDVPIVIDAWGEGSIEGDAREAPFDPQLAVRLLQEAGCAEDIEIYLLVSPDDAELVEMAREIAAALNSIGWAVDLIEVSARDAQSTLATLITAGQSAVWLTR
jgi:hypothetical protein